jgi:UDP-N-acetylmuramyl pentapeptide phosphotransferase/UDP-N-acetylglucosamine-1-phosphate transferase
MLLLIAVAVGVVSSAVSTAVIVPILRRRAVLDVPNHRSSHTRPTVRGGGIGLAIGTLVTLAIAHTGLIGSTGIALVVGGLGFGAIGFADDLNGNVPVRVRLTLQLLVAVGVVSVLWDFASPFTLSVALVCIVAIFWIVSFVNAFNFMDGINGISCAETIVAGVAFGLYGRHEHHLALEIAAFALAAGSIGFAPFNFPSARVFLGDVGSYFAGAWLAVLVVIGLRGSIPVEAMVAPVTLYVADTGMTLARRVHRHEAWYKGHRQHTYQRLVERGWSHTQTTSLVFILVALCSALGSVSLVGSVPLRVAADGGVAVLVAGYLILPGLLERRQSAALQRGHRQSAALQREHRQSAALQREQRLIKQEQPPPREVRMYQARRSRIHR